MKQKYASINDIRYTEYIRKASTVFSSCLKVKAACFIQLRSFESIQYVTAMIDCLHRGQKHGMIYYDATL